ncbi:hypothetical protein CBR_g26228 [Chara braunii]|uniref:Protein kinase domain-containing protein n=1 Tax=Chara braunii TaxID=69332 RepID=A0A388L7C1_CHABU|nr:hypothetical protein CBR_g26228 [Chara braunii]|eukprot:GBG78195.1 hypothetical protein CBR_g26228 [Chara braunii]
MASRVLAAGVSVVESMVSLVKPESNDAIKACGRAAAEGVGGYADEVLLRYFGPFLTPLPLRCQAARHIEDNLKCGLVTVLAASSSSSSSSSSEQPSSPSSMAFGEVNGTGTSAIPWILEESDHRHHYSRRYRCADEQCVHGYRHHQHRRHRQHCQHRQDHQHRQHRLPCEQRREELRQRQIEETYFFEIHDSTLLTKRDNPTRNFSPDWDTTENFWSDVWSLSFSPADGSLFFLMSDRLWRVKTEGPMENGGDDVSLVRGPWRPEGAVEYLQAFALMDDEEVSSAAKNKSLNRNAIVGDSFNLSLRAFNVDNGSVAPPFSVLDYRAITLGEAIVSLAWDSTRRVLYGSSWSALYRMNLSVTTARKPVLERWVGPDLNFYALEDSRDDPRAVRFYGPYFGSSAISADGDFLYVADRLNHVIRRVTTSSGAVETIAGGGFPVSLDANVTYARFDQPVGVAVTSDGCNLFVSEMGRGGRLLLLTLEYHGGPAVSVRTVARKKLSDSVGFVYLLMGMTITPDDKVLYVGTARYTVFELRINTSALPPCSAVPEPPSPPPPPPPAAPPCAPPPAPPPISAPASKGVLIAGVAASVLVVLLAAVVAGIVERRWRCLRSRFSRGERQGTLLGSGPANHPRSSTRRSSPAWSTWSEEVREQQKSSGNDGAVVQLKRPLLVERYSFEEIQEACDGFSAARLVGRGGAADVYKGQLSNGQVVAVKMMKGDFSRAKFRQFQAELDVLGTLRHSHLCSIIGFCEDGEKSLIIYSPFAEGGTLYDRLNCAPTASTAAGEGEDEDASGHIFAAKSVAEREGSLSASSSSSSSPGVGRRGPLSWQDRVSIAQQIARALRYLHEEVDPPVIHRDVKSKNVLLEDGPTGEGGGGREGEGGGHRKTGVRAYLSDFGLAKVGRSVFGRFPAGESVETYNVAGTLGYMAPEYYTSVRLTTKNDVYAFGVVLLELITGRKPFAGSPPTADSKTREQQMGKQEGGIDLASWATRVLGGSFPLSTDRDKSDTLERSVMLAPKTKLNIGERFVEGVRQIADRELLRKEGHVNWSAVCSMAEIAMACISHSPEQRPRVSVVIERLMQLDDDEGGSRR